jgi:hypothetical protein
MLRRAFSWLRGRRTQRPSSAKKPTRDHSPRERFPADAGEIWVGFRLSGDESADEAALQALVDHVESSGLGEWTGQSIGAAQRDVTFDVEDQLRARWAIAAFFTRKLPDRDFWVSLDYQTTFDRV